MRSDTLAGEINKDIWEDLGRTSETRSLSCAKCFELHELCELRLAILSDFCDTGVELSEKVPATTVGL